MYTIVYAIVRNMIFSVLGVSKKRVRDKKSRFVPRLRRIWSSPGLRPSLPTQFYALRNRIALFSLLFKHTLLHFINIIGYNQMFKTDTDLLCASKFFVP